MKRAWIPTKPPRANSPCLEDAAHMHIAVPSTRRRLYRHCRATHRSLRDFVEQRCGGANSCGAFSDADFRIILAARTNQLAQVCPSTLSRFSQSIFGARSQTVGQTNRQHFAALPGTPATGSGQARDATKTWTSRDRESITGDQDEAHYACCSTTRKDAHIVVLSD